MPQSRTGPIADAQEKPGWQSAAVVSLVDMNHVIARILHHMTGAGYTDKEQFGVRLSLEEAMVNAIKHGNHEDPTKKVHVRFQITPYLITTEIEDEGTGFNPERVPNPLAPENIERPGGRGVFLMRHYMTSVQFNERGNCVILSKVRAR